MAYLIGTDEAGYGPNLGPLVITATAWQVPGDPADVELYELLGATVSADPRERSETRLTVADSKKLYRPGSGLAELERGVVASLGLLGRPPESWRAMFAALDPDCQTELERVPWYADYDEAVPIDARRQEVEPLTTLLGQTLEQSASRLHAIRSAVVFPSRFNELVRQRNSKGEVLSTITIDLARQLTDSCDGQPVLIHCDKHGGRNKYGRLLQIAFPDTLVQVRAEGRSESCYGWSLRGQPVECRFVARGETFLPSALASMASKYLRELAMRAFNAFWQERLPDLKATAGYPVDARRFRAEIETRQRELKISDDMLWRSR